MQSMLCATACARTAASVCVRLPYLYDSGWPVLEGVRVHGVEPETQRGAVFAQPLVVVGLVPGNVQRHRGRGAGQLVDDAAVLELSKTLRGSPGPGKRPKRVPPVPTPRKEWPP